MTKVFPIRWCTGASMGPQKPLCHRNLWWILYFIYLYTNHFQETNTPPPKKKKYRFKMEANDLFCFASFQFRQKIREKNHFSKGVFQWNLSHGFSGKSYFPASPKCWFMLISDKTTGFVWFIYLFFISFCFVWFLFIYLFIYFFASKEGYPWGWHLKIALVKHSDTIVIQYRGLRKTVVGPVGTPSLVRLSYVLGVDIKCWYDHFDTRVLVS